MTRLLPSTGVANASAGASASATSRRSGGPARQWSIACSRAGWAATRQRWQDAPRSHASAASKAELQRSDPGRPTQREIAGFGSRSLWGRNGDLSAPWALRRERDRLGRSTGRNDLHLAAVGREETEMCRAATTAVCNEVGARVQRSAHGIEAHRAGHDSERWVHLPEEETGGRRGDPGAGEL